MPKLPSCPYCGYKFDYSRSSKALHEKNVKCKKCGKIMSVSYKLAALKMGFLFFVFLVALNTVYLFNSNSRTILPNIIFTVLFIVLYLVLVPLSVSFSKIDNVWYYFDDLQLAGAEFLERFARDFSPLFGRC